MREALVGIQNSVGQRQRYREGKGILQDGVNKSQSLEREECGTSQKAM